MFLGNNSKSYSRKNNKVPLIAQVHYAYCLPITHFWYHVITSILWHNIKSCKLHKEGYKSNSTYQNRMEGSIKCCKVSSKWIRGDTASSNNKSVKEIKSPLLQKHVVSEPHWINLKIDSGATHHFHEIGSAYLPQQPNCNYNPPALVIVPNRESMVSSATTHLKIPSLPPSATKSCGFNHLESGYLFSVGQACDHNCTCSFWQEFRKNI